MTSKTTTMTLVGEVMELRDLPAPKLHGEGDAYVVRECGHCALYVLEEGQWTHVLKPCIHPLKAA